MKKRREQKPVLHIFVCDAEAYKYEELIGGWLTLPASEDELVRCLCRFSGRYLITDYDLAGSCFAGEWVLGSVLRCQGNLKKLNGYIAGKGVIMEKSVTDKKTLERIRAYRDMYNTIRKEKKKDENKR